MNLQAAELPPPSDNGDLLHQQDMDKLRSVIVELLQQVEFLQQKDVHTVALEARLLQVREANQHLVLAAFGAQDMQATAEAAIARQSEFLAMLAHELRNPLQPIALANELLGQLADTGPDVAKFQGIIGRQVRHMARLVDDLLDASRVSGGKMSMQLIPLSLAEVIAVAVETSRPHIETRRQLLEIELPTLPVMLAGDLARLAQVFSNLLINASKFSPENETISIRAQSRATTVHIVVSDHGMGIPAELQPLIFDLFTQGMRSIERAQGGLGIGLSLVRAIVDVHGGTVSVASGGVGMGSEFTVELPRFPLPQALPLADIKSPMPLTRRRRVLLVEDNIDANETLALLLTQARHVVTQRFDGVTALASALVHQYDVVVCDIGLPGMDGYTLIQKIRAETTGPLPRFIATSGYNQAADRVRAFESGFDHYLVKPVAISELLDLIDQYDL